MIRLHDLLTENTEATADSVKWAKRFKQELGLTPEAAAAMAANIQHESGFIPDRIQGPGIKTGTMSDSGKLGYSWAQWTFGARKQSFRQYVKKLFGVDIAKVPATAKHAYEFLKYELPRYPGFDFDRFKQEKNVDRATEVFVSKYEQAGKPALATRQQIAKDILSKLKSALKPVTKSNEPIDRIGQVIYPRKTSKHDYATIRMSPKVNNGLINNIIKTVKWPEKIGTVINSTIDDRWNTWYRVKLSNGQRGWVRYDVITSNKNEKFL